MDKNEYFDEARFWQTSLTTDADFDKIISFEYSNVPPDYRYYLARYKDKDTWTLRRVKK